MDEAFIEYSPEALAGHLEGDPAARNLKNVYIMDNVLIEHKINMLRDKNTSTADFRRILKEVSMLEGYEVLRNVKQVTREIDTPIESYTANFVDNSSLCFVPILRAGLGMVDGFLELLPNVEVGHIGLYRDEVTKEPHAYYCKLPKDLREKKVILLDPMLATGGSSIDAIKTLKEHGAKDITFACIIAAPEGVRAFKEKYPDIPLYIGTLDRQLNENAYICPGLGDCGDRVFHTFNK